MFTCCGILYNHESPRRPLDFLPRKVAASAAAISLGLETELLLGDLDSRRDWGYAKDYVQAMWLMLQQDEPADYIVATGESHSVEELVECAFARVGSTGATMFAATLVFAGGRRSSIISSAIRPAPGSASGGSRASTSPGS